MKVLISIVLVSLSFFGYSQTKEESLKELKNGKLFIFTYDTTDAETSTYCKEFNHNLYEVFNSKRWDFCKVEYIPVSKIDALVESNGEAFLLIPMEIEFTNAPSTKFNQRSGGNISYLKLGRAKDYVVRKQFFKKNKYVDLKKTLNSAAMANFDIKSMFIGVGYMQKSLYNGILTKEEIIAKKELAKSKEKVSNIQKLKTKTLYIDKDELDGLNEKDIKSIYRHPVKVTSLKEITDAIKENRADVIFIQIQMGPSTQNKDILMVIDADDYSNLAYFTVEVGLTKLDKDVFEKLNKIADKE